MTVEEQRLAALALANEIRLARVAVKRQLREGEITLADALVDPACGSMTVGRLLGAQRMWGPKKVKDALVLADLQAVKPVRELTTRQRGLLTGDVAPAAAVVERVRAAKPHVLDDPTRGTGRAKRSCRGCGIPIAVRTPEMLCGFCLSERTEAA